MSCRSELSPYVRVGNGKMFAMRYTGIQPVKCFGKRYINAMQWPRNGHCPRSWIENTNQRARETWWKKREHGNSFCFGISCSKRWDINFQQTKNLVKPKEWDQWQMFFSQFKDIFETLNLSQFFDIIPENENSNSLNIETF